MNKFNGYLRLMRPVNCFMMGLAVIVGAALASPTRIGGAWLSHTVVTMYMILRTAMNSEPIGVACSSTLFIVI